MSKSPFSRWRESLSNYRPARKSSRQLGRRHLGFESLERRELLAVSALTDFSASSNTGEKPQSKVWEYNDQWYSVMPDSSGTWVWKLNGTAWQHHLQLSTSGGVKADVKVAGDLAHILLYSGSQSQLATIQYDHGADNRYEMWALRPSLVNVSLSSGVETATLDLDSTGRLWIASDASSTVEVRYADVGTQYTNWSAPITVATGISSDDISSIIAMPNGSIGVLWSNQKTDRFGFRLHVDGAAPTTWTADEIPASQSALSKGGGMADDHIHLAVASNGTLYAAVKTSYDSSGYPKIALLVRRPSGVWDNLYQVDTSGTRPILMLNEAAGKLIVAYTSSESGGSIYFKETSMDTISFGARKTLISGSVNNVSSVKGTFTDEVVAIAGGGNVKSSVFRFDTPVTNLPPVVNAGADQTIQLSATATATATLDSTVTDDGKPSPASLLTSWVMLTGPGTVTFGNAAAVDTTAEFSVAGTYVLRLSANDGQIQASDTVTVSVADPASEPTNQPPVVDAGASQSMVLGTPVSLDGTVSDDGMPAAPGVVSTTWTKVSGPGNVAFGDAALVDTSATFSMPGDYVLRLTANDSALSASDTATITVADSSAPITVSFQDGLFPLVSYQGTRDTSIGSDAPSTNRGTATTLEMDGSPDIADLLYWEISAIPAGSIIESVALQLNFTSTSSHVYELYVMQRAWDELAATWNQASAGTLWGTAGATAASDHGSTVLGQIAPSSNGLHQVALNQAGIAAVQQWVDSPSTNRGFIFQDYTVSDGADFRPRETAVAAERPKLVVTYRPGGGSGAGAVSLSAAINRPPQVNAGPDQTVQLPALVNLTGMVTDDGLPSSPGHVTVTWSKVSGPGTVTFANASAANTTAQFSTAGTYVLRLTADDGTEEASDDLTIELLPPLGNLV